MRGLVIALLWRRVLLVTLKVFRPAVIYRRSTAAPDPHREVEGLGRGAQPDLEHRRQQRGVRSVKVG